MPLNFVAKAAITVALTAANMALTMSRKIEGPRLDDLKATGADYGTPLYMLWGMRRLEVPIFWAEELREVKRRRKTKGGKFNEYTYFGTWAVAVAGHEIAAIRRIWFDTHLIYDVSGAGPVTPFDFGSTGDISDAISIYLGTETQEPDPRMQATVEAAQGADSCPAYRGTAYIVFKDMPLEKIGNRIPLVSVEAVSVVNANYPYEIKTPIIDPPSSLDAMAFAMSPDGSRVMWNDGGEGAEIWDLASRSRLVHVTAWPSQGAAGSGIGQAFASDGTIYGISKNSLIDTYLARWSADGLSTEIPDSPAAAGALDLSDGLNNFGGDDVVIAKSVVDEVEVAFVRPYSIYEGLAYLKIGIGLTLDTGPIGWQPRSCFADLDGNIWVIGGVPSDTTMHFKRVHGDYGILPAEFTITMPSSQGALVGVEAFHYRDATVDHFIVNWGGLRTIDLATLTVSSTFGSSGAQFYLENVKPGAASFWVSSTQYQSSDLSVIRSYSNTDLNTNWVFHLNNSGIWHDPVNNALVSANLFTDEMTWRYLDRITSPGITLQSIADDVAVWVGVEDYDFTDLDQTINGWSATRGQAANMIEPLLDAYDSDFRPHDWQIEGIKRTGVASGSTLPTNKFVGSPRYTVGIKQAAELPRSITIDYADIAADQQPNSARVSRPLEATDARSEQKLDLTTLVLTASEGIQLAGRYFRRLWNERKQPSFGLTAQNLELEPGDVRTIELDGDTITARATRVLIKADDSIQTEWRYDSATLATLDGTAGAEFDGREPSEVIIPLVSKTFVLDIPYIKDADEAVSPLLYLASAPYADGSWPGATVFEETGGEYTDEYASIPSTSLATWGYVSQAMAYANPNLWDRGTELTVILQTGELTGCTESEALASPLLNQAAIGSNGRWEIVQFTTATLVTGNTYTVSGFLRGRRGTEWAADLHVAGDQFLLLDVAQDEVRGLSDVGTELSFMAITSGRTTGFPVTITSYAGNSLKPYAPCDLDATKDATTGDWAMTWTRRTRIGGAWTSGTSIPLSETTEEYEVEILDGAAVVRTFTGMTTPEADYTAAQQTTDFGAEVAVGDLDWRVYQISASVDRGFAATGAN